MSKLRKFSGALATILCAALAMPAQAQTKVRDAVYRGTLVCGKLPFIEDPVRAAIEIKIAGNAAQYSRPVRAPRPDSVAGTETGTGTIDGDKISLKGEWRGELGSYSAAYGGHLRAPQRQAHRHANMDARGQELQARMLGRGQAAAGGVPAEGQENRAIIRAAKID